MAELFGKAQRKGERVASQSDHKAYKNERTQFNANKRAWNKAEREIYGTYTK